MAESFIKKAGSDVAQSTDDPTMFLVGAVCPEWVRAPEKLGGGRVPVIGSVMATCICGTGHSVRHLELGSGLRVAECERQGFMWYRLRETAGGGT